MSGMLTGVRKSWKMGRDLGLDPQSIEMLPWYVGYEVGFQTDLEMIRSSQKPGRYVKLY